MPKLFGVGQKWVRLTGKEDKIVLLQLKDHYFNNKNNHLYLKVKLTILIFSPLRVSHHYLFLILDLFSLM